MPDAADRTKSKTRKVLSAVGRPVRGVGRRLGFKRTHANYHGAVANERPDVGSDAETEDSESSGVLVRSQHPAQSCPRGLFALGSFTGSSNGYALIVACLEDRLRHLSLIFAAYLLGTYSGQYAWAVKKTLEYTLVAWVTCALILLLGYVFEKRSKESQGVLDAPATISIKKDGNQLQNDTPDITFDLDMQDEPEETVQQLSQAVMPHPSLEKFFIIDCGTMERIIPNTVDSYKIDTDYFTGEMMLLVRTPDCDNPGATSTPETRAASEYLRDKQRRFEFQFQIRLKKIPTGRVYFSCELCEPVKMGIIQRAFVGAAMAFIKTTNNNFHYCLQASSENGKEEKPHMAFPVEEGMNRVVVTAPGEPLPNLGEEIMEDIEDYKQRRKGLQIDWKLGYTYTLSLWSAYVDFLDWRCINLPGLRPFQLSNVIGLQPITLTLYEIPADRGTDKHFKQDMTQIVEIEMCNSSESGLGKAARLWMQRQGGKLIPRLGSETDLPALRNSQFEESQLNEKISDEQIADEDDVAELGEGIYVRSGDPINLSEVFASPEGDQVDDRSAFITYGAEYVVLQDGSCLSSPATITIEKVSKARSKSSVSSLIKSGDTVIFKLHSKSRYEGKIKSDASEKRYLTVHQGWWLKWAHLSKSGHFIVHTCDDPVDEQEDEMRSRDTQSSLLTFGGAFRISSKKWPKYFVGVAPTGSPTFGGRMLGLYSPRSGQHMQVDDLDPDEENATHEAPTGKNKWLRPLLLRASESSSIGTLASIEASVGRFDCSSQPNYTSLTFSCDTYRVDVPAWVEVMNRSDRVRQLFYVVRVCSQMPSDDGESSEDGATRMPFVRLHTGRELSQVMRAGLWWKNRTSSNVDSIAASRLGRPRVPPIVETLSPKIERSTISFDEVPLSFDESYNEADEPGSVQFSVSIGDGESSAEWFPDSDSDDDGPDVGDDLDLSEPQSNRNRVKRTAQLMGKLSKQTGKTVVATGKSAVRQSVKVGKGTVNASVKVTKGTVSAGAKVGKSAVRAGVMMTKGTVIASKKAGKAIIAPRSKKPPSKEPKFNSQKMGAETGLNDLHLTAKERKPLFGMTEFPDVIAGELSGPDQSCRTVSNMLTKMSSIPLASPYSKNFNALLAFLVHQQSDAGQRFLTGSAVQIGVKTKANKSAGAVCESIIARCIWESHWREELCRVSETGLSFYAPLTDTPCLELLFEDIHDVRLMATVHSSPLPGYPMLAVDTAWTCHYMVFANEEARLTFRSKIMDSLNAFCSSAALRTTKELAQARFWQGFQNSVQSSLSSGRGKWAEVTSGIRQKPRTILNNRRVSFDLPTFDYEPNQFVEELLAKSLSFSLDHLSQRPKDLVDFLDLTCQLRQLDLSDIDLSSVEAFCLVVNLYHCLLQHALLLSVNGPLTKRSFGHFLRTSCYEIGKDVFSLAELHAHVIRGNMSRPTSTKLPAVEPPKKSEAYRFYALGQTSARVNFLLNTGDIACTRAVPILVPSHLDAQLNQQAKEFLKQNVRVDSVKRIIFLPKVCETYRGDFSRESLGAGTAILKYCTPFLDEVTTQAIERQQNDRDSPVAIRFIPASESFHSTLTEYVESLE